MVTIAQRIEALRMQKALSRPALAVALGLPRMSIEKFETGRQTPTQEQQVKLAQYFGVSLAYLRGEADDPSGADSWLSGNVADEPAPRPVPKAAPRPAAQVVQSSGGGAGDGAVFSALLKSKSFQDMVRSTVLEVLRSPEGQQLLAKAVRKELGR